MTTYQSGAYFVTICAYQQLSIFGCVSDGTMHVNDLGMTIKQCWLKIPRVRTNVVLDAFVVMPNHLHGIIIIHDEKLADTDSARSRSAETSSGGLARSSLGVVVGQFKRAATIRSKLLAQPPQQPIWQRNYYEHIIRNEKSLNDIRTYIAQNPAKWLEDSLYVS